MANLTYPLTLSAAEVITTAREIDTSREIGVCDLTELLNYVADQPRDRSWSRAYNEVNGLIMATIPDPAPEYDAPWWD